MQSFTLRNSPNFKNPHLKNKELMVTVAGGLNCFGYGCKWETQQQTEQVRGALLLALLTQTAGGITGMQFRKDLPLC